MRPRRSVDRTVSQRHKNGANVQGGRLRDRLPLPDSWRSAMPAGTVVEVAISELELTVVFEEGEDGFVIASIPEIPGTHSQGRSREEARENVLDALQVMLTPDDALSGEDRESVRLTLRR